jgi:RNA polymerase sigma factor (sigma-70 family)
MPDLPEADRYLLEQIRQGSSDGWAQLVKRYSGRLAAFARSKVGKAGDADDLVQETFISFLKGLPDFRGQASLETYLFGILRRRIVDWYRGRKTNVCLLQDVIKADDTDAPSDTARAMVSPAATASWYARRDEQVDVQREVLGRALAHLVTELTQSLRLRDLKVIEMIFYVQLRNKDIARIAGLPESQVALLKHRYLQRLQEYVQQDLRISRDFAIESLANLPEQFDAVLAEIWQEQRLSCPKRSTIGAYVLGTLEPAWLDYVAFHLDTLGCQFCRANLDDLRRQTESGQTSTLRQRILNSTAGFLRKP